MAALKLKILSYNIHKGFDWKNSRYYLEKIKEIIVATHADIVFLQEVVGKNDKFVKKGLVDAQFEFLADGIWSHYSYAQNAVYDHGHHGNLILSKFPIDSYENINLSTNRFEKRGMLVCKIATPGQSFYAACLHLNLLSRGRSIQYKNIENYILTSDIDSSLPLIIAGDFNDWNKKSGNHFENRLGMSEVFKSLNGHYAKTFPAMFPLLCLDRIYVKDLNILNSRIVLQKKEDILSDHLPLFSEVEFCEE